MTRPDPLQHARNLLAAGELAAAQEECQRQIALEPDNADAWHLSAQVYLAQQQWDDAACQLLSAQALRADPAFSATQREIDLAMLSEHGQMLLRAGRVTEATRAFEQLVERAPERAWAHNNLGTAHMVAGRVERAIELFRKASSLGRPLYQAHSSVLMAMTHSDQCTPEAMLAEHRNWAERYTADFAAGAPVIHDADPDRPIRVGYVSPDFRHHPVAMFIGPVLQHHDRRQVEVTCYDDAVVQDAVKRRLQSYGHRWVHSATMQYEPLFRQIRDDRIDILVDLAVHSGENRQPLFAAGAAPIQMTWLGYAGTTGLPAVQYRITDPIVDPPGLTEAHFTETLLRLPETLWCFGPFADEPDRPPAPSDAGRVRFGTATRLAKVSPSCLDLWCRLMRRVDNATLTLAAEGLGDDALRREWLGHFTSRGIAAERIELLPGREYRDYLRLLGSLDIGLDTLPFNGGTTVCQSLYMGTPVVALAGQTSVSRVSASVVSNAGLPELVAETPEQWIDLNAQLAGDPARRRALHASLRARTLQSPLCDGSRFTRRLEAVYRSVFRERCRA